MKGSKFGCAVSRGGREMRTKKTGESAGKNPVGKALKSSICFFSFGVLCLLYFMLVIISAEDILAGSLFKTSTVVIASGMPVLLVKITAPWFMQKLSYLTRIIVIALLWVLGLLVVLTTGRAEWRLVGISVIQAATALSEITFFALTAFYEEITVSAFVAGQGISCLLGPLFYTGKVLVKNPSPTQSAFRISYLVT